jgi:hypothetical protein
MPADIEKQMPKAVWIDLDDAPELDDKFFERAGEYQGERLIKLGHLGGIDKKNFKCCASINSLTNLCKSIQLLTIFSIHYRFYAN